MKDLRDVRRDYGGNRLRRAGLADDPLMQFDGWLREALATGEADVNAMSLATVSADGQPSLRTVLLKYYDHDGFVFFTNYESAKAQDIAGNPRVALMFFWPALGRQVCIRGVAQKTSRAESARYFLSRPRDSQLGAWVSCQSRAVSSLSLLEQSLARMREKFARGEIPVPAFWGGYRVAPASLEFWQGAPGRLHDRFLYSRAEGEGWRIERLAP